MSWIANKEFWWILGIARDQISLQLITFYTKIGQKLATSFLKRNYQNKYPIILPRNIITTQIINNDSKIIELITSTY